MTDEQVAAPFDRVQICISHGGRSMSCSKVVGAIMNLLDGRSSKDSPKLV